MIKSVNNFWLAWEVVILLFVTSIIFALILIQFPDLRNQVDNSKALWLLYYNLPGILLLLYSFIKTNGSIKFSFRIETYKWYRYLLFLQIITGLLLLSISAYLIINTPGILIQVHSTLSATQNFSVEYYLKSVLFAPFIEELLFRGFILEGLLTRYSPKKSIVLSSLVFGLYHLNFVQFFFAFILGLVFGWYYYKSRNILSCIIFHSAINIIGTVLVEFVIEKAEYHLKASDTKLIHFDNPLIFVVLGILIIISGIYILHKTMTDSNNEP